MKAVVSKISTFRFVILVRKKVQPRQCLCALQRLREECFNGAFCSFRAKSVLQQVVQSPDVLYDPSSSLKKTSGIFSPTAFSARALNFIVFVFSLPCGVRMDCLQRPNTYLSRAENSQSEPGNTIMHSNSESWCNMSSPVRGLPYSFFALLFSSQ